MLARVRVDAENRAKLHANNARFRKRLAESGVHAIGTEYVIPVILGDDEHAVAVATQLQARRFDVRAIRPPTVPAGTARLRVSIHADHTPAEIDELATLLREAVTP